MTTVLSLIGREAGRARRVDAREHVGMARAAGELLHPLGAKRVEAHRHPAEAGRAERLRLPREQHAVGGEREIA